MFEQHSTARRMTAGHSGVAALPQTSAHVGGDIAANAAYGPGDTDAPVRTGPTPVAWKLVPRNKAYVETCTFYSLREALAHADDFDCELVPLFEQTAPAAELRTALAVLRNCVEALRPTAGPDTAPLRAQREAAFHAGVAFLQEVDHG